MSKNKRKRGPNSGETTKRDRSGRRGGFKTTGAKVAAEEEAKRAEEAAIAAKAAENAARLKAVLESKTE